MKFLISYVVEFGHSDDYTCVKEVWKESTVEKIELLNMNGGTDEGYVTRIKDTEKQTYFDTREAPW